MHDIDRTQVGFGYEAESPQYYQQPAGLNENELMEQAAALMEIDNEAEFEAFLGDLISQAASAVGGFIQSPTGKLLVGKLKNLAGQFLPQAAQALAGGEMESEMEIEQREWEAANTFVGLAHEIATTVAQTPSPDPATVNKIVADATSNNAPAPPAHVAPPPMPPMPPLPHLPPPFPGQHPGPCGHHHATSGRWMRRGHQIILIGV